jgi:hypothetical protein
MKLQPRAMMIAVARSIASLNLGVEYRLELQEFSSGFERRLGDHNLDM